MSLATTRSAASHRWPRGRLWQALLAVSLTLNLFFVAGAVWTRFHAAADAPSRAQRLEQIAGELGLDAGQRAGFERYLAAMRARSRDSREQTMPLLGAAWDEVAKPDGDRKQIARLLDEATEMRRRLMQDTTAQTLDFLALLTPTQRAKFVAAVRARQGRWWHSGSQNR